MTPSELDLSFYSTKTGLQYGAGHGQVSDRTRTHSGPSIHTVR